MNKLTIEFLKKTQRTKSICFIFLGIFLTRHLAFSQPDQERGKFIVQSFNREVYKAHEQNWAITQDNRGVMYFGNTDGIMEFDGVSWTIIPAVNHTTPRALAADQSGRIYLGGTNELGLLKPDSTGKLAYCSLKHLLSESDMEFGIVWDIKTINDTVFFRTFSRLFRFHNNTFKSWPAVSSFQQNFVLNNEYFVFDTQNGLMKIHQDELIKDTQTKNILGNVLTHYLHSETKKNSEYKPVTKSQNFDKFNNTIAFTEESIDFLITDFLNLPKPLTINSNRLIINENYIFRTIKDGCLIIDRSNGFSLILNKQRGLPNNLINALYFDLEEGLWLAFNKGLARAEIKSTISYWDEKSGLLGSPYDIIRHNGTIHTTTYQGLYKLVNNKVEQIPGTGQSWCLSTISDPDNKEKSHLLVGCIDGVYQIIDQKAELICNSDYAFVLYQSKAIPDRIYVGTRTGLILLRIKNGSIQYLGKAEGLLDNIRSIAEDINNDIWMGTYRNGIVRITPGKNPEQPEEIQHYGTDAGLPSMKNILVYHFRQDLVFATESGIYNYNPKNDSFESDNLLRYPDNNQSPDIFAFSENDLGNVWMASLKNRKGIMGVANFKEDGSVIWNMNLFKIIPDMLVFKIFADYDGTVWFGGSRGLFHWHGEKGLNVQKYYTALIRKVTLGQDSIIFWGNHFDKKDSSKQILLHQPDNKIPEIKFKNNDISFHFAVPSFPDVSQNRFQYYLQNENEDQVSWSAWTDIPFKEYTNLHEGSYHFMVRAINLYDNISQIDSYRFVILPPWYRTIIAFILYILGVISIFYASLKINSYRLKSANIKLERQVVERTRKITRQKEELLLQHTTILQQKEEIQGQAEILKSINIELEKLSIVASETDNAVLILDAKANIEWANEGFTRLLGFTRQQFIKERGENLFKSSVNPELIKKLKSWHGSKVPLHHETWVLTREGKKIWIQTSITPVLNKQNEIEKIIVVALNITTLKNAEQQILEQKNEIIDSIIYAQRIQSAMLPDQENLEKILPEHFILSLPKSIVSGDFYWVTKIDHTVMITVADCTGHGVPGAFMSVLGISSLNKIVNEDRINEPGMVLEYLRRDIVMALHQSGKEDERGEGMDISLITIDSSNKLSYAGAFNPLFIVRGTPNRIHPADPKYNLIELKADRNPIGIFQNITKPFEIKTETLSRGDSLYMFSDGFIDQFGGPHNMRYTTKKFKSFLLEIQDNKMELQRELLLQEFDNWKGDNQQIDDILILGLRIDHQD